MHLCAQSPGFQFDAGRAILPVLTEVAVFGMAGFRHIGKEKAPNWYQSVRGFSFRTMGLLPKFSPCLIQL